MLVALKEIPLTDVGIFGATDAERNEGVAHMNKEVEILSSLSHPNIVQVRVWHRWKKGGRPAQREPSQHHAGRSRSHRRG